MNVFCVRPRRFNIGNEAIALAMRLLLREALGAQANLIPVPAIESDEEGSLSGLGARTIHEMNLYGHGVVVGGGNLYENGQLDLDVHALERLGPPLLLCGLSHGRIYDQRRRLTARTDSMPDSVIVAVNGVATRSLVRDEATLAHLHSLGLTDTLLGGCPTLWLNDLIGAHPRSGNDRSDGVLVAIRDPALMSVPLPDRVRVHAQLLRIVEALDSEGLGPVRLLCNDKRDIAFASSFGELEYILPDDVFAYLELIRAASLLVSFRLHASLPSFSFGTPAVNLSYDERSLSMMQTIGLGDWDIDFVRDDDVVESVLERVGSLERLAELIEVAQPSWEAQAAVTSAALSAFAEDVRAYSGRVPAA